MSGSDLYPVVNLLKKSMQAVTPLLCATVFSDIFGFNTQLKRQMECAEQAADYSDFTNQIKQDVLSFTTRQAARLHLILSAASTAPELATRWRQELINQLYCRTAL